MGTKKISCALLTAHHISWPLAATMARSLYGMWCLDVYSVASRPLSLNRAAVLIVCQYFCEFSVNNDYNSADSQSNLSHDNLKYSAQVFAVDIMDLDFEGKYPFKEPVHPKMNMYSPSVHPKCGVCVFIGTDL